MISLVSYSASSKCIPQHKVSRLHKAFIITPIVLQILASTAALALFLMGVGVVPASALLGVNVLAEGLFIGYLIYLRKKAGGASKSTPIEQKPTVEDKKSATVEELSEEFKKLLDSEEDSQDLGCDRIYGCIPTKKARIFLGETPTNGALVWGEHVLIQGPKKAEEASLMWGVVAQQNVKAIVRLVPDTASETQDVKGACIPYTPQVGTPINHGLDLSISQTAVVNAMQVIEKVTSFQYTLQQNAKTRDVFVFYFDGWEDKQALPEKEFPRLIKTFEALDALNGPIMIHCNAGVGRSGTFLACYKIYQLHKQNSKESIDLIKFVEDLRCYRCKAVENTRQFKMIVAFDDYLKKQSLINS